MNSKYQIININDFPLTKIYILLNEGMRERLIEHSKYSLKFNKNYDLALWLNKRSLEYELNTKYNGGDIQRWILGSNIDTRTNINHPKYMPLWVISELSKISGISPHEICENVLSYRSSGNGNIIANPKLPIKVTPEFESIIFHMFGDGYVGKGTPSYSQKNNLAQRSFILKIKNCFGDFTEKTYNKKNKKITQIRFPKAITDILTHFYKIKSYNSNKIRIPSKVYISPRLNKIACIISYILDEGNIRDVISIASKNCEFLKDLKKFIESSGYKCKEVRTLKDNTCYLNLSNSSIEQLYEDYKKLIKDFPSCSLANKHHSLVCLALRRKNKSRKKDMDINILNLLKDKKLTVKQISQKLGVSYSAIRLRIKRLYANRKINRFNNNRGFIWSSLDIKNMEKNNIIQRFEHF